MLCRWMQDEKAKKDPDFAPQKVFDIIGYGKTASSPVEAMPLKFLLEKDKSIMNRNKLLSVAEELINEKKNGYNPPQEPIFKLSGNQVMNKMLQTLENLFKQKKKRKNGSKYNLWTPLRVWEFQSRGKNRGFWRSRQFLNQ